MPTGRRLLAYNEVLTLVDVRLASELLSSLLQEGSNSLVVHGFSSLVGAARNLGEGEHVLPHSLGLGKLLQKLLAVSAGEKRGENANSERTTGISNEIAKIQKKNEIPIRVLPPRDFWKRRIPADFCRFRRCSRLYRWLLLSWTTKATIFVWTSWSGSSRFAKRCPILNCRAAASMSTGRHFASPHRESSAQVAAKNRYD